ncbi:hypothetical protein [Chondromyces crocatus]|uniref:Uncharacterized protein n=1 Tax=Chondromyces crocatus TaxID=52 RepID=A0A0K1EA16_CHOCO|nr:hypothetical protein [Chondromyces crocatus]AKT37428.1 uncharacterized protein CMC5_015690 [Chondromyces crocatus]
MILRRPSLIATCTLLLAVAPGCGSDNDPDPPTTTTTTTSTTTTTTDPPDDEERTVGGSVVGLKGTRLVIQNNGGDDLSFDTDGPFTFPTPITAGDTYDVTIAAQPEGINERCWVVRGTGTAGESHVTDVLVRCSVNPGSIDLGNADRCDPLDPGYCLFPFPNDYFTVPDQDAETGRRVALRVDSMPVNAAVDISAVLGQPPGTVVTPGNVPMNPAEWNRNDGFSPGQMLLTLVPELDLQRSGIGGITHMERSLEPDAPVVVIDADTGERHLVWAELDAYATTDATRALIIRAGTNFKEGHRYIAALRGLRRANGDLIEPSPTFAVYRDGAPSDIELLESRRQHMEDLFSRLGTAGIQREGLYLAWDFTIVSRKNLTERMLHIRDDAFAKLGQAAPAFTVTTVTQNPDSNRSRRIQGTFTVPNYLNQANGVPGASFHYAQPDDGLPDQFNGNGTLQANFICNIPRSAIADGNDPLAPVTPGRAALYGHGQQGTASQVNGASATGDISNLYNYVFCATDFIGMASSDGLNIANLVTDFTRMNTLADRLQQGLLNNLFLARLLIHPMGFGSHAAFQNGAENTSVIDTSDVFYYGISQGGILGAALVAVAQDITRGVLGVPGINYSVLLDRAIGFDQLRPLMNAAYGNELDRRFIFSSMQMLWDRGEGNGYAAHLTDDPLPNTPPHKVLMHVAFGDHQVTHWSADIQARTMGARIHMPAIAPGRSEDATPYFGIQPIDGYPFQGSAMFVWDTGPFNAGTNTGTPPPPTTNQPPRVGVDPHNHPRFQAGAREQIDQFLRTNGVVINPCGNAPCFAE